MRRRQPLDVAKGCGTQVTIKAKEQKIANRSIVQSFGCLRVRTNAIQNITENKNASDFGVVKGLNPKMIARAKKCFSASVPNRECKIASKMSNAFFAPHSVRVQD